MKKRLTFLAGVMLAIGFWATPKEASAQYDSQQGEWSCGLRPVVKYAKHFEGESYAQYLANTDKWGYINKQGKVVIPLIYAWADSFSEKYGVAAVGKGKNKGVGVINTKGVAVVPIIPEHTGISPTDEINKKGFIEVYNRKEKSACYSTEGKKFLDFGSYDDWRVRGIEEPYAMFFKERNGVRYFAVYTIKGKIIIPFTASEKPYNNSSNRDRVEVNEKEGYVILASDILEIGTGKLLHENVGFKGNGTFIEKGGKYYLLGKGAKIVDGFVFDDILSVEDENATVSKDGKTMFFNIKTRSFSEDYDEIITVGSGKFIKHDKKLNKWIIPYTDDDNKQQIDTVNNIEIVNSLFVSEKHTYWKSNYYGLALCGNQVTRKHQQFGDIAVVYDIKPVMHNGMKHNRVLQHKAKSYSQLFFFDFDSIIDVIESRNNDRVDYQFVVLGKGKKYYLCGENMGIIKEFTGAEIPLKRFHCNQNNTDYTYYSISNRLIDNRTGKEFKLGNKRISPIANNGNCDHILLYSVDEEKRQEKRQANNGTTYIETIITHIYKIRLVPLAELVKNENAYAKYPESIIRVDPQLHVSIDFSNTPIEIGNGIGYIMSKTHKYTPTSTSTVSDYAFVSAEKGFIIPLINKEIKDVIIVGGDTLGVIYGDKSLFSFKKGYGLVDTKGQVVVKTKYDSIGKFEIVNGEYWALVTDDDKKGYINIAGEEVIPCKYDELSEFKNGVATATKKGKTFQIDTKNNKVK